MFEFVLVAGLSATFLANLASAALTASTPIVLAALGEIISERAGILNLGVEGVMLMSALFSFIIALTTGSLALGFAAGIFVGVVVGVVHAFLSVSLKADQVISGLMITLLGGALTVFFGTDWSQRSIDGVEKVFFPVIGEPLAAIPVVGRALFYSTPTDFLALFLVPLTWYGLYRTNLGREIIAVGEDPETADTVGVPVTRIQYGATILGSALAGLAGAHLILAWINQWSNGMTAGMGWIAIALVIVSRWRPFRALGVAFIFATLSALQIRIQGFEFGDGLIGGVLLDPSFFALYPYIATILVLAWAARQEGDDHLGSPSALAEPYRREE